MRTRGQKPLTIALLMAVLLLTVAYEGSMSADQGPGAIPADGPLARPKSLRQSGVPVEATRASAPPENPQTPEKIALGEKLFFDGRLSVASFKTPNLRNVLVTAPYFHDGSQATLWDVLDHYNKGDGIQDPWLDEDVQPLALSESEIDDVVAFLATLTSAQYQRLGAEELARQRALSRVDRPQRDTARAFAPKPVQPKPSRNCGVVQSDALRN